MEGLTYLDSSGLGMLVVGCEQAKLLNLAFCLVNPVGALRQIFDLAQLPAMMPVHDTKGHLYKPGIFCEGKEAARGKPECMGEYMRM